MNVMLGGLLAVSAHRQLMDAPSSVVNRAFRDALAFGLLIMWPVGVFFYLQWPDWSWLYYLNPRTLSEPLTFLIWLAYPVSVCLGFLIAAVFVRGDSPRVALAVPAIGLIALIAVSAVGFGRFIRLTTYEEFAVAIPVVRGTLPYIWTDRVWGAAMAGLTIFAGLPFAYLFVRNIRQSGSLIPPEKP